MGGRAKPTPKIELLWNPGILPVQKNHYPWFYLNPYCNCHLLSIINAQFPMPNSQPNSQCPIPNSQFPMPNSQFPIPNSQLPFDQLYIFQLKNFGTIHLSQHDLITVIALTQT